MRARLLLVAAAALGFAAAAAQDRLKTMPGYERAQRFTREAGAAVRGGALAVSWSDDGRAFEYPRDGKRFHYDVATRQVSPASDVADGSPHGERQEAALPPRGRQFDRTESPDGSLAAIYRGRNVYVSDPGGANERAVTNDGSAATRVKYGTASWVYGEELSQRTAMWWSPDSRKLAYYRFDERDVSDYYVVMNQTGP